MVLVVVVVGGWGRATHDIEPESRDTSAYLRDSYSDDRRAV